MKNVVTVVGGPPVLRVGQDRVNVFLDGIEIQRRKFRGIVEIRAHRAGPDSVCAQRRQVDLIRPPERVGFGLTLRQRRARRQDWRHGDS
jgi:hypothetical protein